MRKPFKLQRVEPVTQPAATGLDKIRLGLVAFDCPAYELVKWYGVIQTEYGYYRLLNDVIVRDKEYVKFFFKSLRVRRAIKNFSLHMFSHDHRLFASVKTDGFFDRKYDICLTYSIKP